MRAQTYAAPARLSVTKVILWSLLILGLVASAIRFTSGMGAISNLTDEYSWGVWISLDLLCGVATAAGAFMLCGSVYILGMEDFRPLVRPTVLTGFLGYAMVVLALLVDLGRPERIWHMIIYWNPHSPLFEVGWCVMTYTTVLALEFSPVLFEGLKWEKAVRFLHKITLPLIILGVLLSTLHQSSLGSLFLIMADKLHPLWHTPLLPVFFFLSAGTVGLAMTIFESTISGRAYGREPETHLLGRLAKAIPWLLGVYLLLKVGELTWAGELGLLLQPGLAATLFWIEITVGVVTPMVLFALPAVRRNHSALFTAALLVILGLMLNRFNIGLINWTRPPGASYLPHWMELAVSFGIISGGILVYDWVARHLPLFAEEHGHGSH